MSKMISKTKQEVTYDIRFTESELKFIIEVLGIHSNTKLIQTHDDNYDEDCSQFTTETFATMVREGKVNYNLYVQLKEMLEK